MMSEKFQLIIIIENEANTYNIVLSIMPADILAMLGARTSAGNVMMIVQYIYLPSPTQLCVQATESRFKPCHTRKEEG